MKTWSTCAKSVLTLIALMAMGTNAHAQLLKKLGKSAENAAKRTVERRVERETEKKTDAALDSILEPGSNEKKEKDSPLSNGGDSGISGNGQEAGGKTAHPGSASGTNGPQAMTVYSKFDFVPGDKILFFDDFSEDYIGDFPSKWDTNGSGEVVATDGTSEKWFELKSGSTYFPELSELPEDYTIELDLLTMGLDQKTSSVAVLDINLEENNAYDYYRAGKNGVNIRLPLAQYTDVNIRVWNKINNESIINNDVDSDIRQAVLNRPHISIAVNGQRLRFWVNETKFIDIPKLVPAGKVLNYIRFSPDGLENGKDRIFIKNLKVAAGGIDLRKKLLSEGKVSTNAILFDSGSANIKPQSMGIIRQIAQVLQQETSMNLKIVGHTDSDGADDSNLKLSKARADAVKTTLSSIYDIDAKRLSTEGKGESEPLVDNASPQEKALNRRVEFIKQ